MPNAYYKSPVGIARVTEEDGFIVSLSLLDDGFETAIAETELLKNAVEQLDEYFTGKRKVFDLPLRQTGTDFQQKVWEQLMHINYGATISYLQQSKLMNNPLGIRAIASANGKNNIAIIVPCHRVIGSDGGLTGYASGVWRKKWLLEHERAVLGVGQTRLML
ncbi:methylated-DNA--[protein]-cysteine S-methyltransferase [soil metagenome]|jgi:methylated-DNA-[protein]-cysteine S-methyltransferase